MKPRRYLPYVALMFCLSGCTYIREWERKGSIDNLPLELREKYKHEQRQWFEERMKERERWIEEERRR